MKSGRLDSLLALFRGMKSPPIERGGASFEGSAENTTHFPSLSSVIGMMGLIGSPPPSPTLEGIASVPMQQDVISPVASPVLLPNIPGTVEISSNHANFTRTFLKSILTSIDSKDPFVANAWLETLLDAIDLLPKEVVREEILPLVVKKGQSPEIISRLAACKLIGKISTKFDPYILKTEILGVTQSLSQDVSGEVRGSICMQLVSVAKGVGLDSTKSVLLPELVDLCSDEEIGVRLAGINTVVQLLPLLDQETRINTLFPLVRKMCERALRVEDATLPITAHLLGRFCHGLHDDLSEEEKVWFVNYYCTLSKLGLPDAKKPEVPMPDLVAEARSGEYEAECRQQCAYNLPGMIVFAGGPAAYRKYLHDALTSFVTDPSLPVRVTVALAFHQVCILIGSEVGLVREAFLKLLRSENMEILSAVIPNTSHILAAFHHHRVITQASMQKEVVELIGALEQGEETLSISSNWRVHSQALRQMAALALCLPPDLLFSEVVPLMIVRMHTVRPIPCRHSAARTLLVYLRHMDSTEHRDHICNTLITEFSQCISCHKRMLFLNICQMAFELLPSSCFKSYFFKPLLSLHADKVPNIRLKLVNLLPIVKSILVLPDDRQKLQELEMVVGTLLKEETDKDVIAAISSVIYQLDKVEVCERERGSPEGAAIQSILSPEDKSNASHQSLNNNKKSLLQNKKEKLELQTKSAAMNLKASNLTSKQTSSLSARRPNVSGRIPSYVAAERRRSRTFAPEIPPDEKAVIRISSLDPSTDEFLVDAGIRIDEANIQGHSPSSHTEGGVCSTQNCFPHPGTPTPRPPPIYTTASVTPQPFHFQSRLRPPSSSKIPVKGKASETVPTSTAHSENHNSSEVKSRLRIQPRTSRPVSGVHSTPSNPHPITTSRGKSLSHENLCSTRLILSSASKSANATLSETHDSVTSSGQFSHKVSTGGSRIRQPQSRGSRPTSCNSSPGGSRCTSPILNDSRAKKGASASSSPNSSRCASPGREENRLVRGVSGLQKRNTQENLVKAKQVVTSGTSSGKSRASKLPLPKAKK